MAQHLHKLDPHPRTACSPSVDPCAGILSLALPISVLGSNFTSAWLSQKDGQKASSRPQAPRIVEMDEQLSTHVNNMGEAHGCMEHALITN